MRELDRDIAAMLDHDLATPDHNADKKSSLDENREQSEVAGGIFSVFSIFILVKVNVKSSHLDNCLVSLMLALLDLHMMISH